MQIYRRRHHVFYGVLAGIVVLVGIYCIFCTRRYEGSAVIQVQRQSPDGLGLSNMMNNSQSSGDALNAALDLQTQSEILQSDTLALKVIEDLDLEKTYDFQPHFNPIGWVLGLISPNGLSDAPSASLEDAPLRRAHALKVFEKNLTVKVDSGSRLIDINYLSSDPKLAAAVVNHLVAGLSDYSFQTRLSATSQASAWLSGQLASLRTESEKLDTKVATLQKDMSVFSLGENDGKPQIYSTVLDRLQQQTTALTTAESNRIMKGALYQVVKSGDADLISTLAGSTMGGGTGSTNNSFNLIQTLRAQKATLEQQLAHDQAKYGNAYPSLAEESASLQGVNQSIQDELGRLAVRAKNDFEIAQQAEQGTRADYQNAHRAADQLNDKSVEFTIARQEADDSRTLYQDLLKRLKEGGVLESLPSSNITVVDPGRIPAKPKNPNVPLYLAIALVAGIFCAVATSLCVDAVDDKIQDVEELEQLPGVALLGIMPHVRTKKDSQQLEAVASPSSPFTEAVRGLRTSLMLSKSGGAPRVVLITSALPGEGKTTLAKSLAILLAKQGKKILLVEADLRRPGMRRDFGIASKSGLSPMLASGNEGMSLLGAGFALGELANLTILPAGPVPPDPAELLDSARMRSLIATWRSQFDLVVLDGPPVLPVPDAMALAGMVDTTILVARSGLTPRSSLRRAYQLIEEQVDDGRVRIVMNGVKPGSHAYRNYYGYSYNRPYPGDTREGA